MHVQLTDRLQRVRQLAVGRDRSVAAWRDFVQATLGFEVYANHVYQCVHTDPHGEQRHG
jgi:hypothetical protein